MVVDDERDIWRKSTHGALDRSKDLALKVVQAVEGLEQDEAERLAAQREAQERARRRAALLAKRKKQAEEQAAADAFKAQQAEEMRYQRELMAKAKGDASAAVKAATANFKAASAAEAFATDKAKQQADMIYSKKMLLAGVNACRRENNMIFSVLKVCELRMEMRKERPASEMFKDEVDTALDEEKRELIFSRDELTRYVSDGLKIVKEIGETRELLTTGPSRENVTRRAAMQKSASLPSITGGSNSPLANAFRETAPASDLLNKAKSLVPSAFGLGDKCHAVVAAAEKRCELVSQGSNDALDQRKAEIHAFIKNLESQKAGLSSTISDSERRLRDLKMRSARGAIAPEQQAAIDAAENSIFELKDSKRCLEEDWRNKTAAYKIDESCRILTKIRAGAHAMGDLPQAPAH